MSKNTPTFKRIAQSPTGHTLWYTSGGWADGWMAISDQSGATPDTTDDGILYVDFKRDFESRNKGGWYVPLRTETGQKVMTVISNATLVMILKAVWPNPQEK